MVNEWIEFVKTYSKEKNISYTEALKLASKPYKERKEITGKGLKSTTFQKLLEASYSGVEQVEGFTIDKSISSKTSKVYTHPSGQVVVAHRGTSGVLDWGNNAVYATLGDTGYKLTPRFKEAKKVQQTAEKKYGAKNVTTIGHSQGAYQAQLLGEKSREIITLNKATRPQELIYGSSKKKNQYDVRSSTDLVSLFRNPLQLKNDKTINDLGNPLKSHSTNVLKKNKDVIYGDKTTYVN
jgi:hypothetical protein